MSESEDSDTVEFRPKRETSPVNSGGKDRTDSNKTIKERTPRPGTAKSVPGQGCPRTGDGCPGTRYRGHFWLSQDTLSWDIYPTVPGHLTYEIFEKSSEVCGRGLPKGIDASDSDGAIRFLAKRCLC